MFQDVQCGTARFKSKHLKSVHDSSSNTIPIELQENETQTLGGFADGTTQTEVVVTKSKNSTSSENVEEQARVLQFLDRVGSIVLDEMTKNSKNSSYYTGFEKYLEASEEKNVSKLFALRFDYDSYFQTPEAQAQTETTSKTKKHELLPSLKLSCTGVSWNATGSILAAAYGRFDHTGWCNYRSALCLWRVFQSESFNQNKPNTVLETSSGLMCVAFHPKNPLLVAAGSFNGEVLVWDLELEECKQYASNIGDYFHREPVTKVAWVYDAYASPPEYNIASVSGDGKVLFWRLKDKLAYPVEGYVVHLPKLRTTTKESTSTTLMGGKSLAFSSSDKTSRAFVVGSEAGVIVRCFSKTPSMRASDFKGEKKWTATAARIVGKLGTSTAATVRRQIEQCATEKKSKEITLATVYDARVDPMVLYPSANDFNIPHAHKGAIYDIAYSPFRKNLLLSGSADGSIKIFVNGSVTPLWSMDVTSTSSFIYSVAWSRTRPMVFAVASEDGNVYVYDLKQDGNGPILVLNGQKDMNATTNQPTNASTSAAAGAVFTLDFNPRQRNFLAAGDVTGTIHIWKLSWQLANLQSGEMSILETMEEEHAQRLE